MSSLNQVLGLGQSLDQQSLMSYLSLECALSSQRCDTACMTVLLVEAVLLPKKGCQPLYFRTLTMREDNPRSKMYNTIEGNSLGDLYFHFLLDSLCLSCSTMYLTVM